MKFLVSFVILFTLFINNTSAQIHPNNKIDSMVRKGIEELLNQQYSAAKQTFDKLESDFAFNPLGKIFSVAADLIINQDTGEPINSKLLTAKLDKAEELADALIESDKKNAWYLYYKGLSLSYRAFAKGVLGNWVSSLSVGYSAKNRFEDCLDLNPDFLEANIAIGIWKFWSSEKMEFLTWLPFVKDERNDGILQLQKAINNNCFHNYFAAHTLARIYIHNKQPQKAVKIITPFTKQYPESRFFMWDLARAYEDFDRGKAIDAYQKLLASYKKEKLPNNARIYTIYYILAKTYNLMGDRENARDAICAIPRFEKMTEVERDELDDKRGKISSLREILQ